MFDDKKQQLNSIKKKQNTSTLNMTNIELWNGIKEGNCKSFEILYKHYYNPMRNYAIKFGIERETAEDIIQNIFIKFYTNKNNLPQHVNIQSYLFRTLINALLDHNKKINHNLVSLRDIPHLHIHDIYTKKAFNSDGEYDTKLNILKRHIKCLSKKQLKAIHLRFIKEKSWEEMSNILQISPHSCMNLINQSISKLKSAILGEKHRIYLFKFWLYLNINIITNGQTENVCI